MSKKKVSVKKRPQRRNLSGEASLFERIENEGSFEYAFTRYGIDVKEYSLDKALEKEILEIVKDLTPIVKRYDAVMERLEQACDEVNESRNDDE